MLGSSADRWDGVGGISSNSKKNAELISSIKVYLIKAVFEKNLQKSPKLEKVIIKHREKARMPYNEVLAFFFFLSG